MLEALLCLSCFTVAPPAPFLPWAPSCLFKLSKNQSFFENRCNYQSVIKLCFHTLVLFAFSSGSSTFFSLFTPDFIRWGSLCCRFHRRLAMEPFCM